MPLTTDLRLSLRGVLTGVSDFGSPISQPDLTLAFSTADGTSAGLADIIWMDERTVASGGSDPIDLSPITNAIGQSQAPLEIVGIILINAPKSGVANTTNLTLGVGSNPATPAFLGGTNPTVGPIRPGGIFMIWNSENAAGFGAITAATADILNVVNSAGAAATYQIAFVGRTA
jgi:hypothetical protein